jgi:hypothetical protein
MLSSVFGPRHPLLFLLVARAWESNVTRRFPDAPEILAPDIVRSGRRISIAIDSFYHMGGAAIVTVTS